MSELEAMKQYRKILDARKFFILAFLGYPFLAFVLSAFFEEKDFFFPFIISWFILVLFGYFRLLAVNVCPWCSHPFLWKDGNWGSVTFIKKVRCVSCGQPHVDEQSK